jgi:hypothetical protein
MVGWKVGYERLLIVPRIDTRFLAKAKKEHRHKEENERCCSLLLRAGGACPAVVVSILFQRDFIWVAPIRFKATPDGTCGVAIIHGSAVSGKGLNVELPIFLHTQGATVTFLKLKQRLAHAIGAVANGVHSDFSVPLFNMAIVDAVKVFVIFGGVIDKV